MPSVTSLNASMMMETASLLLELSTATSIRNTLRRAAYGARSETASATGNASDLNATTMEVTATIKTVITVPSIRRLTVLLAVYGEW